LFKINVSMVVIYSKNKKQNKASHMRDTNCSINIILDAAFYH